MRIVRIGFTSVKGGRHLSHDRVDLTLTGPVGDRVFCLLDPVRHRVLRTVEHPRLLQTVNRWRQGVLSVDFPGATIEGRPFGAGSVHDVDYWGRRAQVQIIDGPFAAAYSRFLGHEVVLARPVSAGEVVYGSSVSLVTVEAMRWLGERVGRQLEPDRFRSTFVIDAGADPGRPELAWLGRELRVGQARLRVQAAVPRCAVVDLDPGTGRRDAPVLKSLAGSEDGPRAMAFGVDAVVTTPGRVHVGEPVVCCSSSSPLPPSRRSFGS